MASEGSVQVCQGTGTAAEFTRAEHAVVGMLYMAFGVGGVVTNLLLILTLLKDKTLFRGTSSWLHVSLAIGNILVVAPCPFPASSSFSGKWLYGDKLCQAYAFEGMFVGIYAIGTVISLCVERYFVSTRKEAMQQNSSGFYWMATAINVTNALFWAVMPLLGWSRYGMDQTGTLCAIDWQNPDEGYASFMTMLCIASFLLPVTAAVICLYKSLPNGAQQAGSSSSSSSAAAAAATGQDGATSSFTEANLRWLCLAFLALVLVGWGPFAVLCVWAMFGEAASASMLAACIPPLAAKFCTMLYPLAYNIASPRIRAGYLSVLGAGSASEQTYGKSE